MPRESFLGARWVFHSFWLDEVFAPETSCKPETCANLSFSRRGKNLRFNYAPAEEKKEEDLSSRFAKITPTLYSFESGKQHLPERFTKVNRLKPGEIIFLDKHGVSYTMKLKRRKNRSPEYLYIKNCITWGKFCLANGVRAEEPFILELTENRELKFFSEDDNETKRTGSWSESSNEKDPNLDEEVFTCERHQTSEFRSACPEEEHEHSVHPSPQPVLQSTPPPGPSIDKDVVLPNRATRSMLEDLSNTFRKRKKMPSWRFKALRPNKQCCSHGLPRVIEETCVALIPYPTVSAETIPEPSPQAETEDVHVQDSLGREAAQYTPLFSNGDTQCMPSSPPRFLLHSRTDFFTPQPGVLEAESYTTEPSPFAGQSAASDQETMDVSDECSLPSPLVGTNQADDQSSTNEGQNIAVETGFVESSAAPVPPLVNNAATAQGQSATKHVPPVFSDPFPHKLEMLQRQSHIRKNYVEAKSLLKAEFQRRSAELNEQFKRKHDEVEAEYAAKNSEHTSSFGMFSNLQLEVEKSQRQTEIEKNYEEEDSLLTAELQRRRAEVHEEFKRKHDDIEAEYTSFFPSSAHCPMPQPR